MEKFDLDKISAMNGKDGKPAYIVHQNKVYDVSRSKLWANGTHMRLHSAGGDLTAEIEKAPHGPEVLERVPQVGEIADATGAAPEMTPRPEGPAPPRSLFSRYPFLRRHPHPAAVHFPIALVISAALFFLIYLETGAASFEMTAFNCLGLGLLFLPVAMSTGYLTWYLNYGSRPIRPIRIKIVLSWALLFLGSAVLLWRMIAPQTALGADPLRILYAVLFLSLPVLVSVVGWYGGRLTFPLD